MPPVAQTLASRPRQPYQPPRTQLDLQTPFVTTTAVPHCVTIESQDLIAGEAKEIPGGHAGTDALQAYLDAAGESGGLDDARITPSIFQYWGGVGSGIGLSLRGCCGLGKGTWGGLATVSNLTCLDLTSVSSLKDGDLAALLPKLKRLVRLSVKDCRRLTSQSVGVISGARLEALDVGGCVNIGAMALAATAEELARTCREIYAGGLGWDDRSLAALCAPYKLGGLHGLSLGFSDGLTAEGVKAALADKVGGIRRLSLHYCVNAVGAALMEFLGREAQGLLALDVRGNPGMTTLLPLLDARAEKYNERLAAGEKMALGRVYILLRYSGCPQDGGQGVREVYGAMYEVGG